MRKESAQKNKAILPTDINYYFFYFFNKIIKENTILITMEILLCSYWTDRIQQLEKSLKKYARDRKVCISIKSYSEPKDFLAYLKTHQSDIYFLGITHEDTNGIKIGQEVRQKNPNGKIVYLTTKPEYCLDSYSVKASGYLLYPYLEHDLYQLLDEIISKIKKEYCYLRTKKGEEKIYLNEINYVCIENRNLTYHLHNGLTIEGLTLQTSFEKAIEVLKDFPGFLFYPPSLLINLNQIKILGKNSITFENDEIIYFPIKAYDKIKENLWT